MNVFDLFAKISLDTKEYEKGLGNASKNSQSASSKIGNSLKTAGKVGKIAIGAISAAGTAYAGIMAKAAKDTINYGDNVDKMSQKMGLSAKAYQEWDAILEHSGASIESLKPSMKTLANAAQKNDDAFKKLGITQKELKNLSQEELFKRTISELQKMEKGTERTAVTSKLLGRGATELGALLNTSAEDTEKMRKEVHKLGGVMDDKTVKASARMTDKIQDLKTGFSGFKRLLSSGAIPVLEDFVDFGISGIKKISTALKGKGGVNEAVKVMGELLGKGLTKIVPILTNAIGTVAKSIPVFIKTIFSAQNIKIFATSVTDLALSLVDAFSDTLPTFVEGAITFATTLISTVVPKIVAKIPDLIKTIATSLNSGIFELVKGAVNAFTPIFKEADEAYEKAKASAKATAESVVQFADKIKNADVIIADTDKLLSNHGRTVGEINTKIENTETHILDILKNARKEKRKVRDKELEDIKNYQKELNNLSKEEISIYTAQAQIEVDKIKSDKKAGKLDSDTAAKRLKAVQEYVDKAGEALDSWYQKQVTILNNQYSGEEQKKSESYKKQKKQIDDWYRTQEEANNAYVEKSNSIIAKQSSSWIDQSKVSYAKLAKLVEQFRTDTNNSVRNFYIEQYDSADALKGVGKIYGDYLSQLDLEDTSAFLNMQATHKKAGQKIPKTDQKLASDILASFEGLPDNLDDVGRSSLLTLAESMKDQNPKLKNASQMTSEEILSTMRQTLGLPKKKKVNTESKQFKAIGNAIGMGLFSGIWGTFDKIKLVAQKFGNGLINNFKEYWKIKSPSRRAKDEIGKQIGTGVVLGVVDGLSKGKTKVLKSMGGLKDTVKQYGFAFSDELKNATTKMTSTISLPNLSSDVARKASNIEYVRGNSGTTNFNFVLNNPQIRDKREAERLMEQISEELGKQFSQRRRAYG